LEEKLEKENQKKRERFEAARQAALKEAVTTDIESQAGQKKSERGDSHPAPTAARSRGYDRLTIFPTGDKEMEMIGAESSHSQSISSSNAVSISPK
jgi:hypothetical protein